MRIAFLLNRFPVLSETFVLRQITGLLDLGHDVDVYAQWRPDEDVAHEDVAAYRLLERTTYLDLPPASGFWELPVVPLWGETWLPGAVAPVANVKRAVHAVPKLARAVTASPRLALETMSPGEYGYQAASLSALYRLAALASKRRRYDVLHAHFGPIGNNFRFARALWRAPLVVSFHGYDLCTWPREEGAHVYDRLFEQADVVTTHSRYARRRLEELGCPPGKIARLAPGVDLDGVPFRERAAGPDEAVRILSIGRLVPIKGLDVAVRAVAAVTARWPNVRYDIVGDGPERGRLEALIGELDLRETVTLHGARPAGEVRELLARAHLFLHPSRSLDGDEEGFGLAPAEAQAAGLPVVATRTGGIPDVVLDGRSGFLVGAGDRDALAGKLALLLDRRELWPALGRCGRRHVEESFDIRVLNRRLVEIYEGAAR